MISPERNFDAEKSRWMSDDKQINIEADNLVRLRILSVEFQDGGVRTMGDISSDFLGGFEA